MLWSLKVCVPRGTISPASASRIHHTSVVEIKCCRVAVGHILITSHVLVPSLRLQ
jgi:hypothetical protein